MRLDQYLVQQGLATTRSKAQDLIKSKQVKVLRSGTERSRISSSFNVVEGDEVIIHDSLGLLKYVSRSGLKLEGALDHLNFNVESLRVLDVGQSTGGFTDCMVQRGANQVIGIDVGHDQLNDKIKLLSQVSAYEGINARNLKDFFVSHSLKPVQLVVMDVSFISIQTLFSEIFKILEPGGHMLSLVKPQFELGKKSLNKQGVVKTLIHREAMLCEKITNSLTKESFQILDYFPSNLKGKKGNQEFFVFAKKPF